MIIKFKKGVCVSCGTQTFLFARKMCKQCYWKSRQKKKTGELELFKEIWNERIPKSFVSGQELGMFDVKFFAHVLPKDSSKFPLFKLNKENIALLTWEEHTLYDNLTKKCLLEKIKETPGWINLYELMVKLYNEYPVKNIYFKKLQLFDEVFRQVKGLP